MPRRVMTMMNLAVAVGVATLCFGAPAQGETECTQLDLSAALTKADAAYEPAMLLAERVRARGITVRCVLRSHWESTFEQQEGAALYRTDRGDFEALFLPASLTFDRLTVVERMENGFRVYSFSGGPKPWPVNRIESARRMYFIKHGRALVVAIDPELAALLAPALLLE
jgi:hypothetical protein